MVQDKAVVLRAGVVTVDALRQGAERVDTNDVLYNLSVQVSAGPAKQDQATINQLLAAVPNAHYALTFAQNILQAKTVGQTPKVERDPLAGNPLHGLVSGITAEDLYQILKINKH